MMTKWLGSSSYSLLFIAMMFGCNVKETRITNYEGYYDNSLTQIKERGQLVDDIETGIWMYYDKEGNVCQRGSYSRGVQVGTWDYRFSVMKERITWEEQQVNLAHPFRFSLPNTFTEIQSTENSYFFVDSMTQDLLVITVFPDSLLSVADFSQEKQQALLNDFNVIDERHMVVQSENSTRDTLYYADEYHVTPRTINPDTIVIQYLYKKHNNQLLVYSYTTQMETFPRGRFLLSNVFHHSFVSDERVVNPLEKIIVDVREGKSDVN